MWRTLWPCAAEKGLSVIPESHLAEENGTLKFWTSRGKCVLLTRKLYFILFYFSFLTLKLSRCYFVYRYHKCIMFLLISLDKFYQASRTVYAKFEENFLLGWGG
jgi:hypothetical protein